MNRLPIPQSAFPNPQSLSLPRFAFAAPTPYDAPVKTAGLALLLVCSALALAARGQTNTTAADTTAVAERL